MHNESHAFYKWNRVACSRSAAEDRIDLNASCATEGDNAALPYEAQDDTWIVRRRGGSGCALGNVPTRDCVALPARYAAAQSDGDSAGAAPRGCYGEVVVEEAGVGALLVGVLLGLLLPPLLRLLRQLLCTCTPLAVKKARAAEEREMASAAQQQREVSGVQGLRAADGAGDRFRVGVSTGRGAREFGVVDGQASSGDVIYYVAKQSIHQRGLNPALFEVKP
eukprot:2237706-Prymnesium_polylepis.1